MNEASTSADTSATEEAARRQPSSASSVRSFKPPAASKWLALAVLPAVVVGLAVYLAFGSSGGSENVSSLEGFVFLINNGDKVDSLKGKLSPGFPSGFPVYKGARLQTSSLVDDGSGGVSYFVVYVVKASATDVYNYYRGKLDEDPWQAESGNANQELKFLSFSSPVDPDISGNVIIFSSELEGETAVYIALEDLTPESGAKIADKQFQPKASLALPQGFPRDVSIYDDGSSIVLEAHFRKAAGRTQYVVTFLTKKGQADVLKYYETAFRQLGWTVTDSTNTSSGFSLGIDFTDRGNLEGSVATDTFKDDDAYTRVDILVQVNTNRSGGSNRGN